MAGYGDDAGFTAWLADNGYAAPASPPSLAVLRQRGSAYVDGLYGPRFCGEPAGGYLQERAWPRSGARIGCSAIPSDVVPVAIINASYAAALFEADNPDVLSGAITPGQGVKSEQVGPIKVEYVTSGDAVADATPILPLVDGLIGPFLCNEVAQPIGIYAVG